MLVAAELCQSGALPLRQGGSRIRFRLLNPPRPHAGGRRLSTWTLPHLSSILAAVLIEVAMPYTCSIVGGAQSQPSLLPCLPGQHAAGCPACPYCHVPDTGLPGNQPGRHCYNVTLFTETPEKFP